MPAHPPTADLCDAHAALLDSGALRVLPPIFLHFGKSRAFSGPACTLQVFEDNALVRATLETPGAGRVLVIDGGASLRCALVGGQLGLLAEGNGWSGVIVDGCVRDSDELNVCAVGIRARATHPRRAAKHGHGNAHGIVTIAGVRVAPGNWIYADADGILVAEHVLA